MHELNGTDHDFQAAQEIGKIYNSFLDKKLLSEFFLESARGFVQPAEGFLFLSGNDEKLWLETATAQQSQISELQAEAQNALQSGKVILNGGRLFVPLVARSSAIGVACFIKTAPAKFSEKDSAVIQSLAAQAASALKNIFLFEENLRMERLAAIGQTMSVVMHEIKNIIQISKFGLEYFRMGFKEKNQNYLEQGMQIFAKSIREMDGFTYEMLSLTKRYEITPIPMDLKKICEELKNDLQEKADQFHVRLVFSIEETLPEIWGEPRSLYRALLNIVKNAMEACDKEDSKIEIKITARGGDFYEICISDIGEGMDDETKAKLFRAFFSTKGEKGTGLGLLVIERTIKGHRGEIQVESELGKGTSFILTLPQRPPQPVKKNIAA